MLDEDIKKLLVELNMTHFVEEIEKSTQVTAQQETVFLQEITADTPLSKEVLQKLVLDEEAIEDQEVEEERKLQKQVQQVNAQLVSKKKYKKAVGLLFLFAVASYFAWPLVTQVKVEEIVVEKKAVDFHHETLQITQDTLTKLVDERKAALMAVAKEMDALIVLHGEKKQESFASKLTALTAKCQAIDEEYCVKIAHQIKELKEKDGAEAVASFAQLIN